MSQGNAKNNTPGALGPAGGDLAGTYPNPSVSGIQGNTFTPGPPTKGQFVVATTTTNYGAVTLSQDISESGTTPGALTVVALQNNPVQSGILGALQDGYVFTWTGSLWQAANLPGLTTGKELEFMAGTATVPSGIPFTRIGTRVIDLTRMPATFGSLTRTAFFIVDLQATPTATTAEVRLLDVTGTPVLVTNTDMTTIPTTNIVELNSGSLTIGSSSGNIRSDAAHTYEVDVRLNGGTSSDTAIITSARLVITYQ